jgi:hypothetical protein
MDCPPQKVLGEDPISIMNQVAMSTSTSHDFPQMLQSPVGIRIRCHIDVRQAQLLKPRGIPGQKGTG